MKTALEPYNRPDRLRKVIAEVLGIPPEDVTDDTSPGSVATWDSVSHLTVIMAVENEFHVTISADMALQMRSVGDIREYLNSQQIQA